MKYKPTTVYLDPADHALLKREAAERGLSMAELLREITRAHVGESAPAYAAKSWSGLIGVATTVEVVHDADEHDAELDRAADDLYRKKMGSTDA